MPFSAHAVLFKIQLSRWYGISINPENARYEFDNLEIMRFKYSEKAVSKHLICGIVSSQQVFYFIFLPKFMLEAHAE